MRACSPRSSPPPPTRRVLRSPTAHWSARASRGASVSGVPGPCSYAATASTGPPSNASTRCGTSGPLRPTRWCVPGAGPGAGAGAEPVVVAGEGWVLAAFAFDPADTDLPLRASFLPWLDRTIARRLAADAGPVLEAAPAGWVARPSWATGLEGPDGNVEPLRGTRFRAPADAGVYFLRRGAERAGAVVVAAESAESVLDRLRASAIAARFDGRNAEGVDRAAQLTARAWSGNSPRPILAGLLLGALLLLAAESWVSRRDDADEA